MKPIHKYIPFEKITIETGLRASEVEERLISIIETDPEMRKRHWLTGSIKSNKEFEGNIYQGQITISPIINYKNSFLPDISGRIKSLTFGSEIELKLKLKTPIVIFAALWFGIVGLVSLIMFMQILSGNFEPGFIVPFIMLIFGYLVFTLGFKKESIKARKRIMEIVNGTEKYNFQ